MRYIIFLIIIAGCHSKPVNNEQRAIDSVKAYILRTINDPASYQPGSFRVDTLMVTFRNTPEGKLLQEKNNKLWVLASPILNSEGNYDSVAKVIRYNDSILSRTVVDKWKKGWSVMHDFRGKNLFGATILKHYRYTLDSNYKVISEEDAQWYYDMIEEGKYRREQERLDSIANSQKPKPDPYRKF